MEFNSVKIKNYSDSEIDKIILLYKEGMSITKISKILRRQKNNIKKILINKGIFIEGRDNIKFEITTDLGDEIIRLYHLGNSCLTISKIFNVSKTPIVNFLKIKKQLKKGNSDGKKILLTNDQKEKIKKLYLEKLMNTTEISKEMNLNISYVDKFLSKSGFRRSKGESISLRQTGKKRSDSVRKILSDAQQKYSRSGKRIQSGGICKTFIINELICQGTYEKFYVDFLIENKIQLPKNSESIITPFGVYTPDFENTNSFIEIKSDYTYKILIGELVNRWTKKIDTTQYKKIKWVSKNIKPVDILIVDKKNKKITKKWLRDHTE
jgi:transposase